MILDSNDILFDGEDRNEVLNRLSDEILIDSINDQIKNYLVGDYVPENFLDTYDIRFNYLINKYEEEQELCNNLRSIRNDFYLDVIKQLSERFKFSYNLDDELKFNDYTNIKDIYTFLVLHSYENLSLFFTNYIKFNKNDLVKQYSKNNNTKDLSFSNIKRTFKNTAETTIVYNFSNIIDDVISTIEDDNFILSTILEDNDESVLNNNISNLFLNNDDEYALLEEFSDIFFEPLKDTNPESYRLKSSIKFNYINLIS